MSSGYSTDTSLSKSDPNNVDPNNVDSNNVFVDPESKNFCDESRRDKFYEQ